MAQVDFFKDISYIDRRSNGSAQTNKITINVNHITLIQKNYCRIYLLGGYSYELTEDSFDSLMRSL